MRSEIQVPTQASALRTCVEAEGPASLHALGCDCQAFGDPLNGTGCVPVLAAALPRSDG